MKKIEVKRLCYLKGVIDCVDAGKKEIDIPMIRKMIGLSYPSSGFNQMSVELFPLNLISKKSIGPRVNHYSITTRGRKYYEKMSDEYNKARLDYEFEDLFTPNNRTCGAPKVSDPEPILTHTENSAIEGLSNLIDENKKFRGMLTRLHIEIGMTLGLDKKDAD
jgi:hypothetical protein